MKVILARQKYHRRGGAENNLVMLARGLAKRGHEVKVLCRKYEREPADAGIEFIKINVIAKPVSLRTVLFNRAVQKRLSVEKCDIVHSFELLTRQDVYRASGGCSRQWNSLLEKMRPGLLGKIFTYARIHRLIEQERERKAFKGGGCGRVIAISSRVRDELMKHYSLPAEKIEIVYNGVDTERFKPEESGACKKAFTEKYGFGKDDFIMLFSGSGFERKGLGKLIKAAAIAGPGRKLRLVVAGHGHSARYRREAENHIPGGAVFLGGVEKMEEVYRAADLFVLPSIYEPFGSAVLEALASGVPVIVSRQCGASELIEDGRNGLIADDPCGPEELARKIKMVFNEGLRKSLKTAGRQLAEKYSSDSYVEKTIAVYSRYLKEKNG